MSIQSDLFDDRGISTFRGTRDYFGEDAVKRQVVVKAIRDIFELFGFEPLETPAIENERTLQGKYGEEGEMKRFRLAIPFPQEAGLRYDQTLPLARFMSMNWNRFPLPYRRYVIGPVWRNEAPAAGRLREFTQCDFDTVGSSSLLVDAEIVALNFYVLNKLGFKDVYTIELNDRRLLDAITRSLNLSKDAKDLLFRSWDNIEKKDWDTILQELRSPTEKDDQEVPGQSEDVIERINQITVLIQSTAAMSNSDRLQFLRESFQDNEEITTALTQISDLMSLIRAYGVPEERFNFNPLLARGLAYYTGPIFETKVTVKGIGSITGGGRFDKLISQLGGPDYPASGSSFGLERIIDVMDELGIPFPKAERPKVFITIFDYSDLEFSKRSLSVASKLRIDNVIAEVYNGDSKKVGKQIKIAEKKGYQFVIVIGPEEIETNTVSIKNLLTREQIAIDLDQLSLFFSNSQP